MAETNANDSSDADLPGSGRRRREPITTLLIAHGVLALVTVLGMGIDGRNLPEPFFLLFVSMAIGQGSLVGIWIAFGGRATPWRLIGGTVGLIGCTWCLEIGLPQSGAYYWTYYVLAQTVGTGLLLVALRFSGLGINWRPPGSPAPEKQRLQFSIRSLMEWTAGLAVLLGTLPMTPEEFREVFARETLGAFGVFGSSALLALATLWISLGTRRAVARILVLCLALVAASVSMTIVLPGLGGGILLSVCCVFWLVSSLWVLRRAGYRLAWRGSVRL